MTSDKINLVYTTCPDLATAEAVGGALVDSGLAACVNIIPGLVSIYSWHGVRQRDQEVVMLVKTRAAIAADVVAEITRLHPYDTPAVLVLPVTGGSEAFVGWIEAQTLRQGT